jgi:hypothetical protein
MMICPEDAPDEIGAEGIGLREFMQALAFHALIAAGGSYAVGFEKDMTADAIRHGNAMADAMIAERRKETGNDA